MGGGDDVRIADTELLMGLLFCCGVLGILIWGGDVRGCMFFLSFGGRLVSPS